MTKANRKKIAKELLAAAERIENFEEYFCCGAIKLDKARTYLIDLFRDDAQAVDDHVPNAWFQEYYEDEDTDEIRSRRILGLCFAALMAEEGVF